MGNEGDGPGKSLHGKTLAADSLARPDKPTLSTSLQSISAGTRVIEKPVNPIGCVSMKALFDRTEDAGSLAQVIVDTIREPILILDGDQNVLFANSSFHRSFQIASKDMQDLKLFGIDSGVWDTTALRTFLTLPEPRAADVLEMTQDFPRIGERNLLLRAHKVSYRDDAHPVVLLGFEDVTERRAIELEKEYLKKQTDDLLRQKEMLLEEMQHRIVNSLQIIASILMLKARAVTSEETRQHLQDAHRRVMSVAAVQRHLHSSGRDDVIEVRSYLSKLCGSLAESMIGESRPAALQVIADDGTMLSSDAVSVGLIVTELVINALKYAFPDQKKAAEVLVRYEVSGTDWKLSVSDNGVGRGDSEGKNTKGGLGTSLVQALAHQLDAKVGIVSGPEGMMVSITHATFTSRAPQAA